MIKQHFNYFHDNFKKWYKRNTYTNRIFFFKEIVSDHLNVTSKSAKHIYTTRVNMTMIDPKGNPEKVAVTAKVLHDSSIISGILHCFIIKLLGTNLQLLHWNLVHQGYKKNMKYVEMRPAILPCYNNGLITARFHCISLYQSIATMYLIWWNTVYSPLLVLQFEQSIILSKLVYSLKIIKELCRYFLFNKSLWSENVNISSSTLACKSQHMIVVNYM